LNFELKTEEELKTSQSEKDLFIYDLNSLVNESRWRTQYKSFNDKTQGITTAAMHITRTSSATSE